MPIETSPVLSLPYIQAAQAQKHVTHNEALRLLDIAVQLVVESRSQSTPPANPSDGQRFLVPVGASGDWNGHDGEVAVFEGGAYWFVNALPGWRAYLRDEGQTAVMTGAGVWETSAETDQSIARLGVNTAPDVNNQLSVRGPASLFNHDGAGHQVVMNKSAPTDTASLLFQTGYSGRAEIGTTGSDALTIKVSGDGSAWLDALAVDGASGHVSGLAVQQSSEDITPGRLMRTDYGYGPGNLLGTVSESAGVPTGAVIETGSDSNGSFTRFADGTQICAFGMTTSGVGVTTWTFPQTFVGTPHCMATAQSTVPRFTTIGAPLAAQVDVDCWDITGTRQTESVHLLAFGRWF